MKKIVLPLVYFALCFSLLSIEGCKKVWDYYKHHHDKPATNCRIDHIIFPFDKTIFGSTNPFTDTLNITYNNAGNPVKISYAYSKIQLEAQSTWTREKRFRYDDKNRLKVYLYGLSSYTMTSDNPQTLLWHHITYINDHLVRDSIYEFAGGQYLIHDKPDDADSYYHGTFEYVLDNFGRIIKATDIETNSSDSNQGIVYYNYDAKGNLIRPGVTYTNKLNIKQTNKVWQFLSKDYSFNAPEGEATEYDENRLPVSFKNDTPFFFPAESYTPYNELSRVYYECK